MSKKALHLAIQSGLYPHRIAGSALLLGCVASQAAAQDALKTADAKSQSLETIIVTGSNIRRVDLETANPVVTIDRAQIQQSGKLTIGDLMQELPSMAGAQMNPATNNNGAGGQASVSLRGLGSNRTLVLVNGHRLSTTLATGASNVGGNADVNMIPVDMIERIEVLKDGASAVYGSDAIGGVVNFILRTNYQGAEIGTSFGESDHDDGVRKGMHFTLGHTTDKGSLMAGIDYNKQEAVPAGNRSFSSYPAVLSSGEVISQGSSRAPHGRITLPSDLAKTFGCSTVALNSGATGATKLSDYHCFTNDDRFNYQAVGNYDVVPSERTSAFVLGNYKLTDEVEAYVEIFHNKTRGRAQLAPLPLDSSADGVLVSSQNYYNPFGIDFGRNPTTGEQGGDYYSRFSTIGNRRFEFGYTNDQVNAGLKGNFAGTSWNWSANVSYSHQSAIINAENYIFYNGLIASGALGPSYLDSATGKVVCGTPSSGPLSNCTPLNIFNLYDPATIATLGQYKLDYGNHLYSSIKEGDLSADGDLFDLPAGTVKLATGLSYRKQYANSSVDAVANFNPQTNSCLIAFSNCTSPTNGGFSVKEAYAELFVPILKDAPFASALNLDLGDRYSKYSEFGGTNNWKAAIEYKPIDDLLLRYTVTTVFRAPSLSDLYSGGIGAAPNIADPCVGLVGKNAACQYVPGDGSFKGGANSQPNAILMGNNLARQYGYDVPSLKPEQGKSFDYGFVYSPHWVEGLSFNADVYRIYLNDTIVFNSFAGQTFLNTCYALSAANNGGPGGPLCNLILRKTSGPSAGQLSFLVTPGINLGRIDTKGLDVGGTYKLPDTAFGKFSFALDATYIAQFTNNPTPGVPGAVVTGMAGEYNQVFGNFARWRALAAINWNAGPWNASWKAHYISPIKIGYPNAGLGPTADGSQLYVPPATPVFHVGSVIYHDVSVGYQIEPINAVVQVGINNLTDKQPPILYQNNVVNANTDVGTYDVMGRYYFGSLTFKF